MPDAPYAVAVDVRSRKWSVVLSVLTRDTSEEMKHLWRFDSRPHAGKGLPRPTAWW